MKSKEVKTFCFWGSKAFYYSTFEKCIALKNYPGNDSVIFFLIYIILRQACEITE